MKLLGQIAGLIRSKNAGPFTLTLDIMFESEKDFQLVVTSGCLSRQRIAELYGVATEDVELHEYRPAYAIKVTVPRNVASGSPGDTDVYGGQQYGPLVTLEVP